MNAVGCGVHEHTVPHTVRAVPQVLFRRVVGVRKPKEHGLRDYVINVHRRPQDHARDWPGRVNTGDGAGPIIQLLNFVAKIGGWSNS